MIAFNIIVSVVLVLIGATLYRFAIYDYKKGMVTRSEKTNTFWFAVGMSVSSGVFFFAAVIMKILGA